MTDPNFHIETPRLYLSYFQPDNDSHCDFLVELYNTPEFIASVGGKPTPITSRDAARERLAGRFRAEHARNGYGTYLVSLKPSSPAATAEGESEEEGTSFSQRMAACTPVGTVSLMRGKPPECLAAPDLGFAVLPAFMRRGIATEAARAILEYAERENDLYAVLGLFDPSNEASKGVFRSLGFEDRGEAELKIFGGVRAAVWTKPGMERDLSVYGIC